MSDLTGHPPPTAVRFGPTIAPAPRVHEEVRCDGCGTLLSDPRGVRLRPICDEGGAA